MEAKVYNQTGKESGKVTLPATLFDVAWNADLVHQVVTSMMSDKRTPVAHVKDRSEVRGGGAKPWKQKGTGRARHGSSRSPIWIGGGVTHGPRNEKNFARKINKKMKTKALVTVLSQKMRDGEVIFVDELAFGEPKAKEAKQALVALAGGTSCADLATKRKNAALIITGDRDMNRVKSFANFGSVKLDEARNVNPVDLLTYKYLIVENPTKSIEEIETRIK